MDINDRSPRFPSYRQELHNNGVHVKCSPAKGRIVGGAGSADNCTFAGRVERLHSHDFDGPLVCGCDDLDSGE